MITKTVTVTQEIEVTIDEKKFDATFMEEFRASFFPWKTHDQHMEHLAQMYARGLYSEHRADQFIEGYGPANEMGIHVKIGDCETEIEP